MGNLSNSMENLVENIQFAAEARKEDLKALSQAENERIQTAERFIHEIFKANRALAASVREKLLREKKFRSENVEILIDEIQKTNFEIASTLKEKLSEGRMERLNNEKNRVEFARAFLIQVAKANQDLAKSLHEKLIEEKNIRIADEKLRLETSTKFLSELKLEVSELQQAVSGFLQEFYEQRKDLKSDLLRMHEIWRGTEEPQGGGIESGNQEDRIEPKNQNKLPSDWQILEIIAQHPMGIKLKAIGAASGVGDWKILIPIVTSMEEAKTLRKVDNLYFCHNEGS